LCETESLDIYCVMQACVVIDY